MSYLTYLYQALTNARQTVAEIERAIEAAKRPPHTLPPGPGGRRTRDDFLYKPEAISPREEFYNWIEEEENGNS